MLIEKPYKGYKTHRNHLEMKTHLELGDQVLVSPAVDRFEKLEFAATFIGVNEGGCPCFRVRHKVRGKWQYRRVWGYECWWVRKDESERIKRRVARRGAR